MSKADDNLHNNKEILTPTLVADLIQNDFDRHIGYVWVEGEIASLAQPASGHMYFQLKDKKSILKAVIWKGRRNRGGVVENGLSVLVGGTLTIYAPRGEYQLVVDHIEPRGEGALRLAFEKLRACLEAEGLFLKDRKRPLPARPGRVALLSSAHGAAARDFITTAIKRCPSAAISLYPVRVQGTGAAAEIAAALNDLNQWGGFDLIVLTRGGGSLEDLWAFNEEILVRTVSTSRIPTLAAIGHSTDLSLTELAADVQAITPTAAAETVFQDYRFLQLTMTNHLRRLKESIKNLLNDRRHSLTVLNGHLRFERRLLTERQHLDQLLEKINRAITLKLAQARIRLQQIQRNLSLCSPTFHLTQQKKDLHRLKLDLFTTYRRCLEHKRQLLGRTCDQLQLLSPLGVLTRGYSLATNSQGQILRSVSAVKPGDLLNLRLARGRLAVKVTEIHKDEPKT